jgi:hypothetical protein
MFSVTNKMGEDLRGDPTDDETVIGPLNLILNTEHFIKSAYL